MTKIGVEFRINSTKSTCTRLLEMLLIDGESFSSVGNAIWYFQSLETQKHLTGKRGAVTKDCLNETKYLF
jgi:hypothetical protein